eukprot:CAMPEP_0117513016 /NCGR_PEP_ID=MMETSP0784-20121206/29332_1 /TAXON_ID=39447 /ORGANISM="" /LENGTH=148 /DNA_ID=CAMNT_0005308759 /DNA_START=429 /DNA_END=872 /DNA_ORIENTATION=-
MTRSSAAGKTAIATSSGTPQHGSARPQATRLRAAGASRAAEEPPAFQLSRARRTSSLAWVAPCGASPPLKAEGAGTALVMRWSEGPKPAVAAGGARLHDFLEDVLCWMRPLLGTEGMSPSPKIGPPSPACPSNPGHWPIEGALAAIAV